MSKADFSEAEGNLGKLWLTLTLICSLNTLLRLLSSALENVKTEERVLCPALKQRYYLFFVYPALPDFLSVPGPSPQSLLAAWTLEPGLLKGYSRPVKPGHHQQGNISPAAGLQPHQDFRTLPSLWVRGLKWRKEDTRRAPGLQGMEGNASWCLGRHQGSGSTAESGEGRSSYLEHQDEKDARDGGNSDQPPPADGWVHH